MKFQQKKLEKLTPHHFILDSQSAYLKQRKENIDNATAFILMDFAENYSFHIQDEVQVYHWAHQSCTVHPVVCYYKTVKTHCWFPSLCFLSEELWHDVVTVHLIQEKTIQHLKKAVPQLEFVEYFSDGCAAQYKNRKSFHNLCEHEKDFGIKASWSFFATSHGKSPCDGIGGTVKRSTAMESLQQPLENQILNIKYMVAYCSKTLTNITFQILPKKELKIHQVKQKELIGLVSLFTCWLAIMTFFIVARLVDQPIQQGCKKPNLQRYSARKKPKSWKSHNFATMEVDMWMD